MPHLSLGSNGSQHISDSINASNQARSTVLPTFDQVLSKLKPLLDGKTVAGAHKISIKGVSADIVDKLREKGNTSELPGWEKLRYGWLSLFCFAGLRNFKALISLVMS